MFKRIELENFRSFTHLDLDLAGKRDSPKTYALIYGENGSGKTNIVEAVSFLKDSMRTLVVGDEVSLHRRALQTAREQVPDSEGFEAKMVDIADALLSQAETEAKGDCVSRRVCRVKTIGADAPMVTRYTFEVDGRDAVYEMVFGDDGRIVHEKLTYTLNDRSGRYFEVDAADGGIDLRYGSGLISGRKFRSTVTELADKYWGDHTLLAILYFERRNSSPEYIRERMRPEIMRIMDYLDGVMVSSARQDVPAPGGWGFNPCEGVVAAGDEGILEAYGEAIGSFFTRIYTDVVRAHYEFTPGERQTAYKLVFTKRISEVERDVPVTEESSGTRKLLSLLPTLMGCAMGDVVFIDELDSGIHDKLVHDLMAEVLPGVRGQLVITTHNTSLIKDTPPRNVYVIGIDALGNKSVRSLDSMGRTQKGHNNTQRYLDGMFDGVPYIGTVDLEDIASRLDDAIGGRRCARRPPS